MIANTGSKNDKGKAMFQKDRYKPNPLNRPLNISNQRS